MILGLPTATFFCVFIIPSIAVVVAVIYGLTFKDDDKWWTIDELFQTMDDDTKEEK